jgi:uncharacterized paraquat-inducible protein A
MTYDYPSVVNPKQPHWKCPRCSFLVCDIEYLSIIIDAECPRCRRARFHEFHQVNFEKPLAP